MNRYFKYYSLFIALFLIGIFFAKNIAHAVVPSAISNLTSGSLSGSVQLFWSAPASNPSLTDYLVYYRAVGEATWNLFSDGVSTATGATVTGLTNGEYFEFKVNAINADGTSNNSNITQSIPLAVTFTDDFEGYASSSNISGQNGWLKGGTTDWQIVSDSGDQSVTDNGATEYYTTKTISNGDGLAVSTRIKMDAKFAGTTGQPVIPQLWLRKSAQAGATNGYVFFFNNGQNRFYILQDTGFVILTQMNNTKPLTIGTYYTYELEAIDSPDGSVKLNGYIYDVGGTRGAPAITYTDTSGILSSGYFGAGSYFATPSTTATFDNMVVYSSIVSQTTTSYAPRSLSLTPGLEQMSLSWAAPYRNGSSAISDYVVQYKLSTNSSWTTFSDGVSTLTSAVVTGITENSSYDFRVMAVNDSGQGLPSSVMSATPQTPQPPYVTSVNFSGVLRNAQTLTGSGIYNDINDDPEGTSLYKWYRGDTSSGSFSEIAGATNISYTLTPSDVGKYIRFEYTPIASLAPATGTSVLSSSQGPILEKYQYWHLLLGGQSLSTGALASPALSTSALYPNLMPATGLEYTNTPLVNLYENGSGQNGNVETPASGIANTISAQDTSRLLVMSNNGNNGAPYSTLKKGTARYIKGITQATNIKASVETDFNGTYTPKGVILYHGETDYTNGNSASYKSYLVEWQRDYETDLNALASTAGTIPLFVTQMNATLTGEVADAQLEASQENAGKIVLVGPKYQFAYGGDRVHLTNVGSRASGELAGKVIKKVLFDGQTWNPLMPTSIIRNDSVITIAFNIPVGPLQIDTSIVAERENYGFVFEQTGGNTVSINQVEIVESGTKIKITLSDIPTGTDHRLKYAWSCPVNPGNSWCAGASDAQRVGGNIRDSDEYYSNASDSSGVPLYNWLVAFNKPVTLPVPVEQVASVSNGGIVLMHLLGNNINTYTIYGSNGTSSISTANQINCSPILKNKLIFGMKNNKEVSVLQEFLNKNIDSKQLITGNFFYQTLQNVKLFQEQYKSDILTPLSLTRPTGIVAFNTIKKVNSLNCSSR